MSYELVMQALEAGLKASAAARTVQRGMVLDVANIKKADLERGLLCLVAQGGGGFLNYQGREGDGGDLNVTLVAYVCVPEKALPVQLEQAEFAVIEDVLAFCKALPPTGAPLDAVIPISWTQSGQLEHPYGWVTMKLKVRWL